MIFEWLRPWSDIKEHILPLLHQQDLILNIGCGSSSLQQDVLLERPQCSIVSIDFSEEIIHKRTNSDRLTYAVMDVTRMNFPDDQFDMVLDKATMDSIACAPDQDQPRKAISEIHRVLKPRGYYVMISDGPPQLRLPHLRHFNVSVREMGRHFVYVCYKVGEEEHKTALEDDMDM